MLFATAGLGHGGKIPSEPTAPSHGSAEVREVGGSGERGAVRARPRGAAPGGAVPAPRGLSPRRAGRRLVAPRGGRGRPGGLLGQTGRGADRLVREPPADPERVGCPVLQ